MVNFVEQLYLRKRERRFRSLLILIWSDLLDQVKVVFILFCNLSPWISIIIGIVLQISVYSVIALGLI